MVQFLVLTLCLCSWMCRSQYFWYPVNASDITTNFSGGIVRTDVDQSNGNLQHIHLTMNNYGCGSSNPENYWFGVVNDHVSSYSSRWSKIRFKQQFWGSTSCWAILGNTPYPSDTAANYVDLPSTGTMAFDYNQDLITNAMNFYWAGSDTECSSNKNTNFWVDRGGHTYIGYMKVELRRNMSAPFAALYAGTTCTLVGNGETDTRFSEIEVGYLTLAPTNNPTPAPTNNPTPAPTNNPTPVPTIDPTLVPTNNPTNNPTPAPTTDPTSAPTIKPTIAPSVGDDGGVIETTYGQMEDNNGKTVDENELSFVKKNLILLIACMAGVFVCCVLFLMIRHWKKKKKKLKKNTMDNLELGRVTSVSANSPISMNTNTAICEPETLETKTQKQNDGDHGVIGVQDAFSNNNALKMWLDNIGLVEYLDLFLENGFSDGTQPLLELTNDDLKDMSISKVAHRKRILKQIEINKNNQQQMMPLKDMNEGEKLNTKDDVIDTNITPMTDDSDDDDSDNMYDQKGNKTTRGINTIDV